MGRSVCTSSNGEALYLVRLQACADLCVNAKQANTGENRLLSLKNLPGSLKVSVCVCVSMSV